MGWNPAGEGGVCNCVPRDGDGDLGRVRGDREGGGCRSREWRRGQQGSSRAAAGQSSRAAGQQHVGLSRDIGMNKSEESVMLFIARALFPERWCMQEVGTADRQARPRSRFRLAVVRGEWHYLVVVVVDRHRTDTETETGASRAGVGTGGTGE